MKSFWRQNQPTKYKERPKFCVKCNYSIDQFVLRDLLTSVKFCVKFNYSLDQFVLRDLLTSFNSSKQIKGNVEAMSRQSLKQNKENTSWTDSFQYLTTIKKEFLLFTSFSIMLRPFDQGFNKWYDTPILSHWYWSHCRANANYSCMQNSTLLPSQTIELTVIALTKMNVETNR